MPIKITPGFIREGLFLHTLNSLFRDELKDDEMDFMEQRSMAIKVLDADVAFHFRLHARRFEKVSADMRPDLTIAGTLYDFLLLVSRREDPDTLFFNRRLKLSGDTELGLYVKNFLDAVDLSERFRLLHRASLTASRVAEKMGPQIHANTRK